MRWFYHYLKDISKIIWDKQCDHFSEIALFLRILEHYAMKLPKATDNYLSKGW